MNISLETFIRMEELDQEELARVTLAFCDLVTELGYGNEMGGGEDPKVSSVLLVRFVQETDEWEKKAEDKGVMVIHFPTGDEEWARAANEIGVPDSE